MAIDEDTSKLISRIYAGAHDEAQWSAAIAEIVARTGSRFAFVASLDPERRAFPKTAAIGCDEGRFLDGIADYESRKCHEDPTNVFIARNPGLGQLCSTQLFGGVYLADPYVRWNIEALGSAFWQIHYAPPCHGLMLGLALHRTADAGPLAARETRLVSLLFDHMIAARQLAMRVMPLADDQGPALLIDRHGRLREANAAAAALLARCDGLIARDGRLLTCLSAEQAQLDTTLAAALRHEPQQAGGAVLVSRPRGGRRLVLRITPLAQPPSPFDCYRPAALVRIFDPEAGPAAESERLWRQLYGLTGAEARLVQSLQTAEGLPEAAGALGIAHSTARTQLAAVFAKTGLNSQMQLARLAARLSD
jgi:DNA-binding CsgD family transcriptional regulator